MIRKNPNKKVKTRPMNECRCDERLKTKTEESTLLGYTGLLIGSPSIEVIGDSGNLFVYTVNCC
jgi:hypothetical protein